MKDRQAGFGYPCSQTVANHQVFISTNSCTQLSLCILFHFAHLYVNPLCVDAASIIELLTSFAEQRCLALLASFYLTPAWSVYQKCFIK